MDITNYKKYEPIFGSWHIVREIGEGSFGKVFEIEREDFGVTYKAAIKAITVPQSKSEIDRILDDGMDKDSVTAYFRGFVQELVEEFRIMSKLKGESNIVSYEDHMVIEHTDGIGWDILIRMELLTPLTKQAKENALGRDDVIRLGIDICKALELCRNYNIIHRDIKPENVFVSENGRYKLGDFGIAKTVEKTTGGLSKKGTYTYMAPEVYKGEQYGASVDIYSLGIMLYRYMNNNRTPFLPDFPQVITYADRENSMVRRIKGEAIPAPANADAELAKIILKACAYDPKDRFSSPSEMREALEAVAARSVAVLIPEQPAEAVGEDKTVGMFGAVKIPVAENPSEAVTVSGELSEENDSAIYEEKSAADAYEKTVSLFAGNCSAKHSKGSMPNDEAYEQEIKNKSLNESFGAELNKDVHPKGKRIKEKIGNWQVENVFDDADRLVEKIEYTSQGNCFRVTCYSVDGNVEKTELYDYKDRIRKRMYFNSDGVTINCEEFSYKN